MAREIAYLDAIREALREEMRRDAQVFVLGEDVGAYGGAFGITKGLQEEFGEYRCLDMPISESCIIGVSVGASLRGFRPVAEMQFGDFITCGFDQIVNQAATLRYRYGGRVACPIVVRAPVGGNVAGGLYHSQNPESWFVHRPGLKVVAPSTAWDAKGLLKAAIRDDNPVIYLEHKYLYRRAKGPVPEGDEIVPIGKAAVRREGGDITLVTYGAMVMASLEAADRLSKEGVEVEVIDLRTLAPWDKAAVFASLDKTNRLLVVHEDVKTLGLGRRDLRRDHGGEVRRARRAGDARDVPGLALPVLARARAGEPAERGQDRRRGAEAGGVSAGQKRFPEARRSRKPENEPPGFCRQKAGPHFVAPARLRPFRLSFRLRRSLGSRGRETLLASPVLSFVQAGLRARRRGVRTRSGTRGRGRGAASTRWPESRSASAISPSSRRSAKAGAGRTAGRRSARPSARANSALVTGYGAVAFSGPSSAGRRDRPPDQRHPVVAVNPRHVLPAGPEGAAGAEPEGQQHLREGADLRGRAPRPSGRRRRGCRRSGPRAPRVSHSSHNSARKSVPCAADSVSSSPPRSP